MSTARNWVETSNAHATRPSTGVQVERIGVERTLAAAQQADIVVMVLDAQVSSALVILSHLCHGRPGEQRLEG